MVSLDADEAELWLGEPFERYRGIDGFRASWSPEDKVIECNVFRADGRLVHSLHGYLEVLNKLRSQASNKVFLEPVPRVELDSSTGLSISIGLCSNIQGLLEHGESFLDPDDPDDPQLDHRPLTLRLQGAEVQSHDDARELLRRVGYSTLFHIDISLGLPLTLERESDFERNPGFLKRAKGTDSMAPVRFEYEPEPMTLYWHAKVASAMPLLQFLAYYQVLEYYFLNYSAYEAKSAAQDILKDPTFDPMRDPDITKLIGAIKSWLRGKAFGTQSQQLTATVRGCCTPEDLHSFILENESLHDYYTSEAPNKLVGEEVPVRTKSDYREDVAKRISELRNRIVHTKSGYDGQEPLFPFDPEVQYLHHDIDLVEFLARKVLIASSRPLRS